MGFTFKGITSESMGIVVNSIQTYVKPQKKADVIQVEGRDGAEVVEYGYAPYILKAKVTLMDLSLIDDVVAWLNGSGVLIIDEDNLKYRNVRVLSEIGYEFFSHLKSATIEFYVSDPYRYEVLEVARTISTFPNSITNAGNTVAKPILTIVGSGSITVTLNGVTIGYTFPAGESVKIDCKNMDASYNGALRNQYMTGNFPSLSVGANSISVTGSVTSVSMSEYSRWL